MTRTFAALAVILLAPGALLAAPTGLEYAPPAPPQPPDVAALVFRLVLMTAVLIGLCALVVWLARRTNRLQTGSEGGSGRVRHEGTLTLDRACAVHLLAVDGQTVAVTTDATGLRSLVLLSEPFDAALDAEAGTAPVPTPLPAPAITKLPDDVRQLLQRLVRRGDGPGVHLEPALRDNQP